MMQSGPGSPVRLRLGQRLDGAVQFGDFAPQVRVHLLSALQLLPQDFRLLFVVQRLLQTEKTPRLKDSGHTEYAVLCRIQLQPLDTRTSIISSVKSSKKYILEKRPRQNPSQAIT